MRYLAIALLLLLASLPAQSVIGGCTASNFQQPCPTGAPLILATGQATPGGVVSYHADTVGWSLTTWIVVADGVQPGIPVPGVFGDLLLNPVTATTVTPGVSPTFPGHVATDVVIPNDPAMIGLELHAQALQGIAGLLALSYAWGVTIQ